MIDLSKHTIIDLSKMVAPNDPSNADRPFDMAEGRLPDGTYKFDIANTHSHVGTHVETPWHFFHEGKTISDFPIQKFMGNARLFRAHIQGNSGRVTLDQLQAALEPHRGTFSILVLRNDSGLDSLPFAMDAVPYIRGLEIDLLVFEASIAFGASVEDGREFHRILMEKDICFVEFPEHLDRLEKDEFFLFAVPVSIKQIDSGMCRLFSVY